MKDEAKYRKIMLDAGLQPNWPYHQAFRKSYEIYLHGLVPKFLEEIKFNRVVCVFLDTYTWNETNNLAMPLPFQLTRQLSDFAELLWAGLNSMEDVVNNLECFMQLLNYTVAKTGEQVPIILFNLLPTEGVQVTDRQAEQIVNAITLSKYKKDHWLEDLNADIEFLNPYIGEAEKLVLFAVPEETFNKFGDIVLSPRRIPFKAINRFEAMNCGSQIEIDFKKVMAFLQTLAENQTYTQKEFDNYCMRFNKRG